MRTCVASDPVDADGPRARHQECQQAHKHKGGNDHLDGGSRDIASRRRWM